MKRFIYTVLAIATGMIAYRLYHGVLTAIILAIFWPITCIKWLICQEVTLTVLKATFGWFMK